MNFPWPDPKEFEQFLVASTPGVKKPDALYINPDTWKDLMMGPASHMWVALVRYQKESVGGGNYILDIKVHIKKEIKKNLIVAMWLEPVKQEGYSWEEPSKGGMFEVINKIALEYHRASDTEKNCLKEMGEGSGEVTIEKLEEWYETTKKSGVLKNRLVTAARVIERIRKREVEKK